MKTFIAIISILFGALFINITINQFEKAGNILLTLYGITLCVLRAIVLSNRGIANGRIYTKVLGIGIAMILFGIAFVLKPGDTGSSFGILIIVIGSLFSIVDYLWTKV
ncbi:hypothetical protein KD050_07235 [Psychrobacillus sp. INOP01]|uniref:hypothetical protein n=1 Tax=Psychrobacillus sp. INOP01 TaxID=2829187 RepID=UPI001BAB4910|nr:hypothetical protein [Psychrobacillus sp. INOP01]QUG43022.1 hypothetical protein KD050_07235 [Psychrobacillus sp. INOP01]